MLEANAIAIIEEAAALMLEGAINRNQAPNTGGVSIDAAVPFVEAERLLGRMLKDDELLFRVRADIE